MARVLILFAHPVLEKSRVHARIIRHLKSIEGRAENRFDAYDQMNAGMLHVYRETVDTALRVGVDAMRFLGYRTYTAQRAACTFLRLDEANLKKLASIKDFDEYIISARADIEELDKILQQDAPHLFGPVDKGWDEEGLIEEANKNMNGS